MDLHKILLEEYGSDLPDSVILSIHSSDGSSRDVFYKNIDGKLIQTMSKED